MSPDAWPSPDTPPAALPRLEDLPISGGGYDQEAVRVAFDSFYRHAAQLDASLRALEAVEAFRRDADALRNDLRALHALGIGAAPAEPAWATTSYDRARPEVPGVVLRLAAEAALIVAVAVIAGVAHFRSAAIVALMAAAFVIVAVSEWLASRARFVPPAVAFLPPLEPEGEPAPYIEAPAPELDQAWGAPALEPAEDTEPDSALTIIEARSDEPETADDDADADGDDVEADDDETDDAEVDDDAAPDPWEQGAPEEADGDDELDEPEAELAERSGFFRRRRR